jgi:hypothetical protein
MLHDMQVGTDRMFLDNNNCIFNWSKHEQKTGLRNLDSYQAELFRIPYNLREGTSQVRFFIWAQNITAVGDYPVLQVFMRNQFVGEFTVTNSIRTAWNAPQLHTTAAVTNVAGLRNGDIYVALKTTSATQRLCELIQVSIFEE